MDIAREIYTDSFYIVNGGIPLIAVTAVRIRAEWIHAFLEIAKGPSTFRSTSQSWFHNKWRNCSRMNILSQKWANISYREQAQIWNYTPSRIRAIFWKMHKAQAVTGPRHNTDFRTIDEIIIG